MPVYRFCKKNKNTQNYFIIILLVFLCNSNVIAGEAHLIINGKSFHNSNTSYNEKNYGMGIQYDFNRVNKNLVPFVNMGGFTDSYENPSYYIGGGLYNRTKFRNDWKTIRFDAGMSFFLMSRVQTNDSGNRENNLIPGMLPMISVGTSNTAMNIVYIPKTQMTKVSLWFVQFKVKLQSF